ncbi:hypothetical protein BDR26DRAFT_859482 [Obelidium mucronatum]|nr:hypothetical protein BDR26DRAFT_859482 [Obelidium mucronatum]
MESTPKYAVTKGGQPCQSCIRKGDYCRRWISHNPKCLGFKRDGLQCGSYATGPSRYCRPDHDPSNQRSTDPSVLRLASSFHKKVKSVVLEYRNGKDAYTLSPVAHSEPHECDHVMELHVVLAPYDVVRLKPSGSNAKSQVQTLLYDLKNNFANETSNLNFTTKEINQFKFAMNKGFIDDYRYERDSLHQQGLFSYMPTGLTRKITRRIQKETWDSFDMGRDSIVYNFVDSFAKERYLEELQDVFTSMKLK